MNVHAPEVIRREDMRAALKRQCSNLGHAVEFLAALAGTRRPRIGYVGGWLGHANLGDEALLGATKMLFPRASVVAYDPHWNCRSVMGLAKTLRSFRYALLGGGTRIFRSSFALECARKGFSLSKRRFVFGTGVANPSFWGGQSDWVDQRREWVDALRDCFYVGVRGPISAQLLIENGLKDVEVIGDPVLAFARDASSASAWMPDSLGLNVGRCARMWGEQSSMNEEFAQLARLAKRAGWKVTWFVVWPEDLPVTREIAEASGTSEHIHEIYDDPQAYMKLVEPMSVFVGVKLHAVVLATCAYVPALMVEYRPKCRDYMLSIGQEQNTVRANCFKAEDAWETVKLWNCRREPSSLALRKTIEPMRNKQRQRAQSLWSAFETSAGGRIMDRTTAEASA